MSIAVPLYGFGASGGGSGGTLTVTAPANVTVTVSKDGKTKTKNSGTTGVVVFKGLASGTWTVTITGDGKTAQKNVIITTDYSTAISFNTIPEFTYTGDYEIVNDSDEPITVSQDNWKIRFLTSGTLTFTNLNGAEGGIDVFLVGGGGGGGMGAYGAFRGTGGGGGYTTTKRNVEIAVNTPYKIIVGSGGACATNSGTDGNDGGNTTAFSVTANGGKHGNKGGGSVPNGGNGGSGGGCGGNDNDGNYRTSAGGTDGSNGKDAYRDDSIYAKGGSGQGTTTREFGETGNTAYSPGGPGASSEYSVSTVQGSGGRGGGHENGTKTDGKPGIVIIRNARGAA